MPVRLSDLAPALYTLFTSDADLAAAESGFCIRKRVWTGPTFSQTLALGWLHRPNASLESLAAKLDVSAQSLQQRFTPEAVDFLGRLIGRALETAFDPPPEAIPLLEKFNGVFGEDITSIPLPVSCRTAFPGCGGRGPDACQAGMKVYLRWNLATGEFADLELTSARTSDVQTGRVHAALPPGSLRLADLGFFDTDLLQGYSDQGVFWISRLPPGIWVRAGDRTDAEPLIDFLARQKGFSVDVPVVVGKSGTLSGRLVAWRCPPEVVTRRLAKQDRTAARKGKRVSARLRAMAEWVVMVTNLPTDRFDANEVWVLYRARWQLELLFKRWKSQMALDEVTCRTECGALCQVLGRLLGAVVSGWAQAMRGGPLSGLRLTRAVAAVQDAALGLWLAFRERTPGLLVVRLQGLKRELDRMKEPKRKRLSTRQLLFHPQPPALS